MRRVVAGRAVLVDMRGAVEGVGEVVSEVDEAGAVNGHHQDEQAHHRDEPGKSGQPATPGRLP